MTGRDTIRNVFFEECEDLLEALSDGLEDLAAGDSDPETVNAIFRAVHSIKGGASAFALDDLVGFAHSFETVLDGVRSGDFTLESSLLQLLQKSGDVLAHLTEAARDETDIDTELVSATLSALDEKLGDQAGSGEEFEFESLGATIDLGLDFEATASVDADNGAHNGFSIRFAPTAELYAFGHDPLALIRATTELGSATVVADVSGLPKFDEIDWQGSFLAWTIELTTDRPQAAVAEIFEFVEGLCELEIKHIEAPVAASAPLPQSTAATPPSLPEPAVAAAPDPAPSISEAATQIVQDAQPDKEAPASERGGPKKVSRATLRVDVDRIDTLINSVGELIIKQAMITQRVRELGVGLPPELSTDLDDYQQLARNIQEGVMGLRTQPLKQLFQRMRRIARESSEVAGKSVRLELEGEETEVDKKVIEKLADPLTHMIRNAIDHGIETPEKRVEKDKPSEGVVTLSACYKSGDVQIQICDDGAGLNRARILQSAVDKGLVEEGASLSVGEIDHLLFHPGFSTAAEVTSLSGRGVGMDVVKTAITSLGGRVNISSRPGAGSTFSILLPLTLAVLDGMVVRIGHEMVVIPIACVEEALRPQKNELNDVGTGQFVYHCRGEYLPVIDLAQHLGLPSKTKKMTKRVILLVQTSSGRMALIVDQVIDKRQVVIKSLSKNYRSVPGISAATILGDGKVALIIDSEALSIEAAAIRDVASRSGAISTVEEVLDVA